MNNEEKILLLLQDQNKRFDKIDQKFEQIDKRFDQIDKRFQQIDNRFDKLDRRLDSMQEELDMNTRILLKIEHEHGEQLRALYDIHITNKESIDELRPRISKLEQFAEETSVKFAFLKTANA